MGPAVNLTIAVLVLVVGFLLVRSPRGWMRRFLRRGQLERVLIEDALKHLYNCHESQVAGSVDGIAGRWNWAVTALRSWPISSSSGGWYGRQRRGWS